VLTVTPAALTSIAVTPANPSIATGLTQQFTATGTYSDNSTKDLTSQVTWASATTSVATITAAGLATAVGTGTSTISAALDGITGTTVLTVTPAALTSIAVTPANPSIAKGTTQQFTATGTYTDSTTQNLTSQVTWASATTTVATITAGGLATAVGTGTSTISAKLDGITGSTVLTVTVPQLSPIAVKDNSQAGYYQYGLWTVASGGYLGNYAFANPATSSTASSHWMLTVPAGTYDIWATWVNAASNATNTGYSIYDGFSKLGTVQVNQQLAPGDGSYGGVLWAELGTFTVKNGQITIAESATGANGDIVADGVLMVPNNSATAGAVLPSLAPGAAPSSTSGPIGPIVPATSSGRDPGTATAMPGAPIAAPVQVSSPVETPAPVVTVLYSGDSASGPAASTPEPGKPSSLTHRALAKIKAKHHPKVRESLIERLARERVSTKQPSRNKP
jgi:hypothetical protein